MKIPFLGGKNQPEYNFHNDETLHNQASGTLAWGVQDLVPLAKLGLTKTFNKGGLAGLAKSELPKLDINDPLSKSVTQQMVSMLWGSMLHAPLSYRGPEFQYRSVDGSHNNIMYPTLGQAGLPYAKSVQGQQAMHGARPDPGDLFDLLMARNDNGDESYVGISSLLLYQATLVIHDIFRTDDDTDKSKTSSYLDLAPLYGNSQSEQEAVRMMKDGLLKPDTFAEDRLLDQPPGVCIFIIMYNRFHNYVTQQLLEINENGKFSLPPDVQELRTMDESQRTWDKVSKDVYDAALKKQDNDLFQTARLITCGLYAQIAIHDYLRCLMRMHEKDTAWTLDPRGAYPEANNQKGLQRGEGNMVSVEFNLLYRFHSPLSARDAKWSEDAFIGLLNHPPIPKPADWKPYVVNDDVVVSEEDKMNGIRITKQGVRDGEVPVPKFQAVFQGLKKLINTDAYKESKNKAYWPPGLDRVGATPGRYRFERDPKTGKFDDAQLAAEMIRVIEDPICHFGAQNIPKVFRSVEVLGILQARKWEVATLNEFREFFGMPRHKNFEDVNTDPKIQDVLRDLYEDPDQIELYPGVYCEGDKRNADPDEKMPNDAGSALWRGIFSDAVTLVRSDRFYTIDWNVQSLTAWGMQEVMSNPKVNKGSCFHRLFQRAFPGYFRYNSLHMWQPFFTPTKNAYLAQKQGYLDQLDLSGLEWVTKDQTKSAVPANFAKTPVLFEKECYPDPKQPPVKMLRKNLKKKADADPQDPWRGMEVAALASNPVTISSYATIQKTINSPEWVNPAVVEIQDIPEGPLRDILTHKWVPWNDVLQTVGAVLKQLGHSADNDKFLAYFTGLAKHIREREERSFQYLKGKAPWDAHTEVVDSETDPVKADKKKRVQQLDIVKDYSIPVVTRFVADFLGFYDRVKTDMNSAARQRELTENQIYQHIENCQNYTSYDSDPTKTLERRQAFKKSMKVLSDLSMYGIQKSEKFAIFSEEPNAFSSGRSYGDLDEYREQPFVIDVRRIGVKLIQALEVQFGREQVAAIMLATALDATHKVVLTFTEIVAYFIDPKQQAESEVKQKEVFDKWAHLQKLAREDTKESHDTIKKYVLEGQRITHKLKLVRVYQPKDISVKSGAVGIQIDKYGQAVEKEVEAGDTVLLDLYTASHEKPIWEADEGSAVSKFDINRTTPYLIYGNDTHPPTFSKQLSLTALVGMLKHIAMLKNLRVAHDKLGRLKKVYTPCGLIYDAAGGYKKIKTIGHIERYCNAQWDVLLSSPVTWNLRYDNEGLGVYRGPDNADQGHGMNQISIVPEMFELDFKVGHAVDDSKTARPRRKSEKTKNLSDRAGVTVTT